MESIVASVKNILLREKQLNFTDEWYEACVDWIKEDHTPSQISVAFLRDEVCNQWLDANLAEIGCKCLPDKLLSQKCVTLPGQYALQVNVVEDIGESSYSQWTKLKKLENENTNISAVDSNESKPNWEPKPRRCLYLTLTDGTQEIFGMEFVAIPALNVEIKPGAKVLVSGPIECRRGVLHLKPGNLRFLGGEVESLIESNGFEQILQRRLNHQAGTREDLPRPKYIGGGVLSKKLKQNHSQTSQATVHSQKTQPVTWNPHQTSFSRPSSPSHRTFSSNPVHNPEPDPFGDDDDEAFMDIDETLILSQAQQANVNDITIVIPHNQASSRNQSQECNNRKPEPVVVDLLDDDDDDEDFLIAETNQLGSIRPPIKTYAVPRSPYQYIKTAKERLSTMKNGEIILVKACVATLVSNISAKDGQWTLTVSLNDGSGFIEARIDPELLNKVIGFSFSEMKILKAHPANRNKINLGLAQLTTTLVHMNGIFGIKRQGSSPVIATFQDIENGHVQSLRNRLNLYS